MAVFFTSDTHFGDPRVLRIDRRPFASLDEHDAALIRSWNEVVSPSDEIWHLGDFALGPPADRIQEILASLNGTKHLVIGNNDGRATLAASGWASIQHYAEITLDGGAPCDVPLSFPDVEPDGSRRARFPWSQLSKQYVAPTLCITSRQSADLGRLSATVL